MQPSTHHLNVLTGWTRLSCANTQECRSPWLGRHLQGRADTMKITGTLVHIRQWLGDWPGLDRLVQRQVAVTG